MFSVDRKALLAALETLKTVTPAKSSIPVLANVTLRADGSSVRLSATDLYRSAWVTLPGEGSGAWARSADLRTVLDRAKRFRNGHCDLSAEGTTALCLTEGARHFKVAGDAPEDTPPLPAEEKSEALFTLDDAALAAAIDRVLPSVSRDEPRARLNAVLFEVTRENLRLVATDGHRLALWNVPVDGPKTAVGVLLSLEGVQSLRALIKPRKGTRDPVVVTMAGSHVFARVRGVTLALRKVDALFPPYAQVIPATSSRVVSCDRALLAEAVDAVGACASPRTGGVKLIVDAESIRVHVASAEGEASETVPARVSGTHGRFTIGINATYLADALAAVDDPTIALGFSAELDPLVIRPKGGGVFVLMPMRI